MACAIDLSQTAVELPPHASSTSTTSVSQHNTAEVRGRPGNIVLTHIFCQLQMLTFTFGVLIYF